MSEQQRRRPVAERRDQLIEAAIHVLATEGLASATTRRITEQAGLSLGAFHYVFTSKSDLLQAVIERFSDGVEQVLLASADDADGDLETFAARIVRGYWQFVESTTQLQLAQYELTVHALRDPELRPLAELLYTRMARAVGVVMDQIPGLSLSDEERGTVARYLAATMDGLILQHVVQGDVEAARARLRLYEHTLGAIIADILEPRRQRTV